MIAFLFLVVQLLLSANAAIIPQKVISQGPRPLTNKPLPLVIWHGLGDNYAAEGLATVAKLAEEVNPGTYTYLVRLDDDANADRRNTFFGNLTEQVDAVCSAIVRNPILNSSPAINAMGFSQGGQFLRAFVERCNFPPVANLVTFGSQHMGISEFQKCDDGDWVCYGARALLRGNAWSSLVQSKLVPAQYFRDPEDMADYLLYSNFLADINNERPIKNKMYAENMKKLDNFVMYVFENDTTVIPKESGWFSEVNLTSKHETKLQDLPLYKEDWLGLKTLDEQDKLHFLTTKGGHMHLTDKLLRDVFETYFAAPSN